MRRAAEILHAGGLVAFPTETVYGLGANALDARAVTKIFTAKGRPTWDPLIVHIANEQQLQQVVERVPAKAQQMIGAFWPGPLTLLLPRHRQLPDAVTAGRPKVAVRMPADPLALRLLELAAVPIAAPSANSFGRTSPTRAEYVLEDLAGRIDAIIDCGQTALGLESTVVDVGETPPILYRPGMVTLERLKAICPDMVRYRVPETPAVAQDSEPSPGVGLKHYAPRAKLTLIEPASAAAIAALVAELASAGRQAGIMLFEEWAPAAQEFSSARIFSWGKRDDQEQLAHRLFSGLRELDSAGVDVILCPLPSTDGLGEALRDRLIKAACPDESPR